MVGVPSGGILGFMVYTKILVPTDGSPCSDRAIDEAVNLALPLGAEVRFLCVVDVLSVMRDGLVNAGESVDAMRAEAREAVARGEEAARRVSVAARGEVIDGAPAEEIVREAAGADLVVLGSHGKGLLKQLVLGSVTQVVLLRADRPVLVVNCKHPTPARV